MTNRRRDGILIRQWFNECGIDESKDRETGADSKRYHRGGSSSECRILTELPKGEAQILDHAFEKWNGGAITVSFFCLIDATKLHYRDAPGFLRRHAGADVVVDMHLQVALELIRKVTLVFKKQSSEPQQPRTNFSHD